MPVISEQKAIRPQFFYHFKAHSNHSMSELNTGPSIVHTPLQPGQQETWHISLKQSTETVAKVSKFAVPVQMFLV